MPQAALIAHLQTAVTQQDEARIAQLAPRLQAADLADVLRDEKPKMSRMVLNQLDQAQQAAVFGYLPLKLQRRIMKKMSLDAAAHLLSYMDSDERADLFKKMDEAWQTQVLKLMAQEKREDLRRMASYAEDTAGAIMTSEYASIPESVNVGEALDIVRHTAPDAETISRIFVLDEQQVLLGMVKLRDLILATPNTPVSHIMETDIAAIATDQDQEEAVRLISRYDLLTLPVVDKQHRLVGIVTHDDAMDVAEEEATEDMLKSSTVGNLESSLSEASLFILYRKRIVWLVLLVFANIVSAAGIALYEDTIAQYIVLVFFLPLLVGSAGNAGSQASTLMVRGLATGDVRLKDWGKMFGREFVVALGLGVTMALAVSLIGAARGGLPIAMVVAFSMVAVVMIGSLVGMTLPFLLNRVGWDPATASAPLVATIADAVGVLVYFSIATAVLGL